MAIEFALRHGIAVLTCSDRVRNADLVEALRQCAAIPGFEAHTPVFIDDSASTYRPATAEIRETGQLLTGLRELHGHRIAVLVASPASFGIGRMVEVFTELVDIQIRTFLDRAEALVWLEEPLAHGRQDHDGQGR